MSTAFTYTHSVQFVDFPQDRVEERGPLTVDGAITAFRTFPYEEQQRKARSLQAPTFPTLSIRSAPDNAVLAIWSLEPDEYEVYMEREGQQVTSATTDGAWIEACIRAFFAGERASLFDTLSASSRAVTEIGLLDRIRSLFS